MGALLTSEKDIEEIIAIILRRGRTNLFEPKKNLMMSYRGNKFIYIKLRIN
jgi:ribosome maturation protein Sdo1